MKVVCVEEEGLAPTLRGFQVDEKFILRRRKMGRSSTNDFDRQRTRCQRFTSRGLKGSWSLCSIPEDRNISPALFLIPCHKKNRHSDDDDSAYEDEEPIYHRSPVTLENGYRPTTLSPSEVFELQCINDDSDGSESSFSSYESSEYLHSRGRVEAEFGLPPGDQEDVLDGQSSSMFCDLIALVLIVLQLFIITCLLCFGLACISVSIVLISHHLRQSSYSPISHQDPSELSNLDWSPQPTQTSPHLIEPTVDEAVTSEPSNQDPNTQVDRETIFQLVPEQEVIEEEDRSEKVPSTNHERYVVKAVPKVFAENVENVENVDPAVNEQVSVNDDNSAVINTSTDQNVEDVTENVEKVEFEQSAQNESVESVSEAPELVSESGNIETPNKTEPDIPSFREWTQKALEEEQKKREEEKRKKDEEREKKKQQLNNQKQQEISDNVSAPATNQRQGSVNPTNVGVRQKKNFASPDCGAKIVSANPESQGASNILSSYRDEYMLNKCSDKAWFVVELCESIKAHKIEIANFELYSSVPHEFRVSLGNVFPAREKDWSVFGNFRAEDERMLQEFTSKGGGVYGKYVKVEILSHHGSEHYCPISLFKIYGTPEIELIGEEEDDNDDDDNDNSANIVSKSDQVQDPNQNLNSNNVLKFIQQKFGETFEKVVGVFKTKDQNSDVDMFQALNKSSLVGTTFAYEIDCPNCNDHQLREVYFLLATNFQKMSQALSNTQIRVALAKSGVCESYGLNVSLTENTTHLHVGHSLVRFYTTLFGASRIVALCNILAIEQGLGRQADVGSKNSVEKSTDNELADKNDSNSTKDSSYESKTSDPVTENSPASSSQVPSAKPESQFHPPQVDKPSSSLFDITSTLSTISETLLSSPTTTLSSDTDEKVNPELKETIITDSSKSEDKVESISPTPVSQASNPSVESPVAKDSELKDPPEVVLVPPTDASHIHQDGKGEAADGANGNKQLLNGQSGRESVWQKLSNRIKTLERNVTLSSGYLEELSVQYKKQIEDLQMSVRLVSESLTLSTRGREKDQLMLKQLQDDVANLSSVVVNLTIQMDSLRTWAVVAHVFVLIAEAAIGGLFLVACYKRLRRQQLDLMIPANASLTCVTTSSTQPVVVHVNGRLPSSATPTRSTSTPMKRGYSLEDLDIEESEGGSNHGELSRRMSLDNMLPPNRDVRVNRKINGHILSADVPLTRKQRRRLQRRLSLGKCLDRRIQELVIIPDPESNSDGDEWTPVVRAGSVDRTPPPALETVTTLPNGRTFFPPLPASSFFKVPLATSNPFGVLNSSLHDDPTPIKERSLNYHLNLETFGHPHSAKKLKFSPEVFDKDHDGLHQHQDGDSNYLSAPKQSSVRSGMLKRSKSTSPTRSKNQVAKQRDIFKHFNPNRANWIKH